MTIAEIFSLLRSQDVKLWTDEGKLRYAAPAGVMTPDLRETLTEQKEAIVAFLQQATASVKAPQIVRRSNNGNIPLSSGQERMWFVDQLRGDSSAFVMPSTARVVGPLNEVALKRSLNEIVRRHEALRTRFESVDGRPFQVIAKDCPVPGCTVDLTGVPESRRNPEAQRLVNEESARTFDLKKGPFLRFLIVRLTPKERLVVIVTHHIAFDGWSAGIFQRELAALYDAFCDGEKSPLPELDIQYGDFAQWQKGLTESEHFESQIESWKRQLADPPVLRIPTDRTKNEAIGFRGSEQTFVLTKDLSESLRALSRREGVTLFMTLLAAFTSLLRRYSGQDDIIVGTPIAGRNRHELENMIGLFMNPAALRADLSGDPTFRELLTRVRDVALHAYSNQDVPFETLVKVLQPRRQARQEPLFQVMFILQNMNTEAQVKSDDATLEHRGLTIHPQEAESDHVQYTVALVMYDEDASISGTFEYLSDLFEPATITRMLSHFQALLEGIVSDPEQPISQLSLLDDAERSQVLEMGRGVAADDSQDVCIHELFERQVEQTPDAVAVMLEDQLLTYQQLNIRANQLARHLMDLGVAPGTLVGICTGRCLEMLVALLGVLKAGGAYVPLDPMYPSERLTSMIEDAGIPILVTHQSVRSRLQVPAADAAPRLVCLDEDWETIAGRRVGNPRGGATPACPAYVIYTSGSTGKPKGVVIAHRSLVNFTAGACRSYEIDDHDRVLQFAPIIFDTSAEEIYPCLLNGATLVLRTDAMLQSVGEFMQKCQQWGITVLDLPTAYWHVVASQTDASDWQVPDCLRFVIIGGERAIPERLTAWHNRVGHDVRLVNTYGPTEATVVATTWESTGIADSDGFVRELPIGRPEQNVQTYVLDDQLRPVPIGVPGQLHIAGDGLAQGYLNRPELTAASFIPNSLTSEQLGERLYRTGDLVRYLPDGNLEFLGRVDHQVKVRGYRIELGEIESVLSQHPAVQEAVLEAREYEPGDTRLVAYVVAKTENKDLTTEELLDFLRERLPVYMVPSAFVMLDELPLTGSGKVDRRALPAPDPAQRNLAENYVAPRNPTEEIIAEIWAKLLSVESVGIHDDFFALGGHSLLATQVISRLRQAFEFELPLVQLFDTPTVAGLAGSIQTLREDDRYRQVPPIKPVGRDQPLPLSYAQERLWFIQQLLPDSSTYHMAATWPLKGPLNLSALQRTFIEIIRRHETLRTTLPSVDGRPLQVIAPPSCMTVPIVDLRALPSEARAVAVRRLQREGHRPFDLARGPLFRVALLRLSEQDYAFAMTMHHIISDGWSMTVVWREVAALYQAFSTGQPSPLPRLPIQYADFAVWQRQWLTEEVLQQQLDYWKQQLGGMPETLELPTDRPRSNSRLQRMSSRHRDMPEDLSQQLTELSRREGVTLFMTLLAAYQLLLHRHTEQEDIVVGTPIANRNRAELEGLIGFFVNTLVLRSDLSGNPSFRELLGRVREVALGAYSHQDLPFAKIVAELRPDREMNGVPLIQSMFLLQNGPAPQQSQDEASAEDGVETGIKLFDLTLTMVQSDRGLSASFGYDADLFDSNTIERLLVHFERLLKGVVENPEQSLLDIPLDARPQPELESPTLLPATDDFVFEEA